MNAAVVLPLMEIGTPVHITGVTSNGYWRIEIDYTEWNIINHTFKIAHTVTNNTPYTIDVDIASGGATIYDGYTDETSNGGRYVFEYRLNGKKQEVETSGIVPGSTVSGYSTYSIHDEYMAEQRVFRFETTYIVNKNRAVHGSVSDRIQFRPIIFYDYTTTATRIEGVNEMWPLSRWF